VSPEVSKSNVQIIYFALLRAGHAVADLFVNI
jgi:hypothetical protein